jgi:DNA-binding winged helix-turn-helix (wHTH) protein/Tol biopolymer transport system component
LAQPIQSDKDAPSTSWRFAPFELNPATGELRKNGHRVKLSEQPFRVLVALLENNGELLTREDLQRRIWPVETAGDFEQGLNRAVSKLREALGDRPVKPLFIETLPGRGYRFIGVLQKEEPSHLLPTPRPGKPWILAVLAAGILAVAIAGAARLIRTSQPLRLRGHKLTSDNYSKSAPALSDGTRIYFSATFAHEQFIAQIPLAGGQPVRVPVTPPAPSFILQDLSSDGQQILLTADTENNRLHLMPLWSLRIPDGTARRLGSIVAISAAYSPSNHSIAFSTPTELWTALPDGSGARRLVEAKDSLMGAVRWSPDEQRIRFARRDPFSNYAIPWEVDAEGRGLHRLFPNWNGVSLIPSGWGSSGRVGVFAGEGTFWGTLETSLLGLRRSPGEPKRLLDDASEFDTGVRIPKNSDAFYTVGTDRLGELERYNRVTGTWTAFLDGLSGEAVEYSPDGQRVAYITYPQRTLWVRQTNGTRPIQLTSPPMVAIFPRWSPDGKTIAFSASDTSDSAMKLRLVNAEGGPVRIVLRDTEGSQGFPSWSPDGKSLLYGIINSSTREEVYIRVADIGTGRVTRQAGSDGLFAPRYSPDGTMIAALQLEAAHHLMIFHANSGHWEEVPEHRVDWPSWTPDSKFIICKFGDVLMRYSIGTRKFETVADIKPNELGGFQHWIGVDLDGSPLRTRNRDTKQIYSLQFTTE